ncbi:MetQ/NlpA family ABC transporter substrate-binding protein [Paludibacterium yongneupense]|uniref:MetQ/NlpA family ABC transporter substrate-binding protein n=1 Tax=Paludibacterium yongneupense TaxID=400061 RepID=UPI00040A4346|nr:MetQ/NlpA family ABC transporter substrate-binding protein [Paludibacterium yongneupense]
MAMSPIRFFLRSGPHSGRLLALITALTLVTVPVLGAEPPVTKTIRVGIVGDEDVEIWKGVAAEARRHGLKIEAVPFSDYVLPNEALERHELDANAFQHKPYLDNQVKTRGYHIVPVAYTAIWPIGLYSRRHPSVAALPKGAKIGVPNDPSNEGRALFLLQAQGLIKLKPGATILATVSDIVSNPRGVVIKEFDAGIVGREIDELDAAVVNTDWALKSRIDVNKEKIAQEPIRGNPYANFIAVRTGDANASWVKTLAAAYQTDATKQSLAQQYHGTAVPAW